MLTTCQSEWNNLCCPIGCQGGGTRGSPPHWSRSWWESILPVPDLKTKNKFKSASPSESAEASFLELYKILKSPTRHLVHYMLLAKGTLHLQNNDYRDNATRAT